MLQCSYHSSMGVKAFSYFLVRWKLQPCTYVGLKFGCLYLAPNILFLQYFFLRSWMLCPYQQRCNVTLLQPAQILRISEGSKGDLVILYCARDWVWSSRCSAYAVENMVWLAESFYPGSWDSRLPSSGFDLHEQDFVCSCGVICDPWAGPSVASSCTPFLWSPSSTPWAASA